MTKMRQNKFSQRKKEKIFFYLKGQLSRLLQETLFLNDVLKFA